MVFFYRRFLPLDVFIYAFGAENAASSSNLYPLCQNNEAVSNFAFETASYYFDFYAFFGYYTDSIANTTLGYSLILSRTLLSVSLFFLFIRRMTSIPTFPVIPLRGTVTWISCA